MKLLETPYDLPETGKFGRVAESTRRSMRANKSRGTLPELSLRRAVWAAGLRGYRLNRKGLPGSPDLVFGPAKVAVFLHGCFWHGCSVPGHSRVPTKNHDYWLAKIERNRTRDEEVLVRLSEMGWNAVVLWECEWKQDPEECLVKIARALGKAIKDSSP